MNHIKLFESIGSELKATELYSIIERGDTDIDVVYTSKQVAESKCVKKNQEFNQWLESKGQKVNFLEKYIVMDLSDTIQLIKDNIYENSNQPGEEY